MLSRRLNLLKIFTITIAKGSTRSSAFRASEVPLAQFLSSIYRAQGSPFLGTIVLKDTLAEVTRCS